VGIYHYPVSSDSKKNVVFVAIAVLWPVSWLHKNIPVLLGDNICLNIIGTYSDPWQLKKV
jgi:hypothetical protein